MEAPKKIYVTKYDLDKLEENGIFGSSWHRKRTQGSDTEYIRSDLAELTAEDLNIILSIFKDMRNTGDWFKYSVPEEELLIRVNEQRRK